LKLTFEWHEEKARKNFQKHRVSFEEAKTVFNDPFLMTFPDPDHSKMNSDISISAFLQRDEC